MSNKHSILGNKKETSAGSYKDIKNIEAQHIENMRAQHTKFRTHDDGEKIYVTGSGRRSLPEKVMIGLGSAVAVVGTVTLGVIGYNAATESEAVRGFTQSDDCEGISGIFTDAVSDNPCKINVQFPLSLPGVDGETPIEDPFYLQLDTRAEVAYYEQDNIMALIVEVDAVPLDSYTQTKASLKTSSEQLTAAGIIDGLAVGGLAAECAVVSQALVGAVHKYADAFAVNQDGFSAIDTAYVDHRTSFAPFTDVPLPLLTDIPRREVRFTDDGNYLTCE